MLKKKLTVLVMSNYAGMKTGFGGFKRELLSHLYKTDKYNLVSYAAAVPWYNKDFERFPWKTYGALPTNPQDLQRLAQDPELQRAANYGALNIDKVIQEVKPDVFIGIEDVWGLAFCSTKAWWNKIPSIVHTTLDSRPILQQAVDLAKTTPYFYSWADFATKDMNKIQGCEHVKTLRGSVNTEVFRRLTDVQRKDLRKRLNIPEDAFCIGMLSRNQLRKSFPNIIEGFKKFKEKHPEVKNPRLLFYTHFSEGWNIPKICKEYDIPTSEVLCTYKCRVTGNYYVAPFQGENLNSPEGYEKSLITVNIKDGLPEEQVNEWFNLLDVYCHAFTSGGQERGIQEAKLAELITLVTNYSCGEDNCAPEAFSLPLDWEPYREPNDAQFIKATTKSDSIAYQLSKVYKMNASRRKEWGEKARKWVLDNFSIEVIGKQFEDILDSFPISNYNFEFQAEKQNPEAKIPEIPENAEWLITMYRVILGRNVDSNDKGVQDWLLSLKNNVPRKAIEDFFRNKAREHNTELDKKTLKDVLGPEAPEDRVLITMPKSLGDCMYLTALLEDARNLYKDKKIYVAAEPNYLEVFLPLVGRYIDCVLPWIPAMDNVYALEGYGGNNKLFQIVLAPHFRTQRNVDYIHNGEDKTNFNLNATS